EQDAFVIFDDVEIPEERIFIDGRVDVYNDIRSTGIMENLTNQTTIRALNKLEFAYGLAARMAETINDQSPGTLEMLGELLSYVIVGTAPAADCVEADQHQHAGAGAAHEDHQAFPQPPRRRHERAVDPHRPSAKHIDESAQPEAER